MFPARASGRKNRIHPLPHGQFDGILRRVLLFVNPRRVQITDIIEPCHTVHAALHLGQIPRFTAPQVHIVVMEHIGGRHRVPRRLVPHIQGITHVLEHGTYLVIGGLYELLVQRGPVITFREGAPPSTSLRKRYRKGWECSIGTYSPHTSSCANRGSADSSVYLPFQKLAS